MLDDPGVPAGDAADAATFAILIDAVRDLSRAREIHDVVDVVRHAARRLVDADGATFVLREGDQCFYVDEDAISPLWRGQRFAMTDCISGWSMNHDESVVIPDVFVDDRIPQDAYRKTFVHSLIMTPIGAPSPLGAVGVYWAGAHQGTDAEVVVLRALADSAAVALENVRVLTELDRASAKTEQLELTNRDLAAFASIAAHDLRAPLTKILGHAENVQDLDRDHLTADGMAELDAMQRQVHKMSGLIQTVLDYSFAASQDLVREPVPLRPLVRNVIDDLSATITQRAVTIDIGDLPTVYGSPRLIERVVQNLVANAVLYAGPDEPRVWITGLVAPADTGLVVADNGPGVPAAERQTIFEMFTRGSAAHRATGTGIGLAFAQRVVERHSGTLTVAESAVGGAAFTMTLPKPGAPFDDVLD